MRTFTPLQFDRRPSPTSRKHFRRSLHICWMIVTLAAVPHGAQPATAQPSPARGGVASARQQRVDRRPSAERPPLMPVQAAPAPAPPQAAETPHWPVNGPPSAPSVVWDSRGLSIDARNSSLDQILKEVSTDTGAQVEGLGADERIFGFYGPGQPRDVLSQLLEGSGYNVIIIGDQGQGAPRQIVLSERPKGPAPVVPSQPGGSDQDYEAEEPPPPPPQPEPPMQQPRFNPEIQGRTPQQIMQEMQQREQQMRTQQNNQQN